MLLSTLTNYLLRLDNFSNILSGEGEVSPVETVSGAGLLWDFTFVLYHQPLRSHTIDTSAVLSEVNWIMVGSASLLAGILSLLTSVAGLPKVPDEPIG